MTNLESNIISESNMTFEEVFRQRKEHLRKECKKLDRNIEKKTLDVYHWFGFHNSDNFTICTAHKVWLSFTQNSVLLLDGILPESKEDRKDFFHPGLFSVLFRMFRSFEKLDALAKLSCVIFLI